MIAAAIPSDELSEDACVRPSAIAVVLRSMPHESVSEFVPYSPCRLERRNVHNEDYQSLQLDQMATD